VDDVTAPPEDPVLARLFARYRAAHALTRSPGADLTAVDALLEARVALYEHLVRTGWDAPDLVRRQLHVDSLLLEQPPSAVAG
jgi:hypothetical protein